MKNLTIYPTLIFKFLEHTITYYCYTPLIGEHKVAMDCTGKEGKVSSLVNRINNSTILDELNSLKGNALIENINKNKEVVSNKLLKQADILVDLLKLTYKDELNTNLQKQNIKLTKNKIAIIGGAGFIGSHLTNLYGNTNSNHSRSNEFGERFLNIINE